MKNFMAVMVLGALAASSGADEPVTYNKHVARILWQHCASCHHKGAVAPFPLLTYKDAARRAKFLVDITASRRMPPWRAEAGHGPFANERRLNDADIKTIAAWVAGGAVEGEAKDLGKAPEFPDGWQLGKPDVIVKMPAAFKIPATGPDVYRCFVLTLPFGDEKTVAAVEFHPGNARVIHHAGFHLDTAHKGRELEGKTSDGQPGYTSFGGPGFAAAGSLGGWGLAALPRFLPADTGMLLPAGSDLVMQIHYHPTGKEEVDQSELGIYFAKKPATKYVSTFISRTTDIAIPAGAKDHGVACSSAPLPVDVTVLTVTPHMHFLGRKIAVSAAFPDGKTLTLVSVKDWDFHWHERYQLTAPLRLPKGTVIHVKGVYDNSADNPSNPNQPPKLVRYGNNLTDEMISGHLEVVVDSRADLQVLQKMRAMRAGKGAEK